MPMRANIGPEQVEQNGIPYSGFMGPQIGTRLLKTKLLCIQNKTPNVLQSPG
jgi:hypothetical protein